MVAPQTPTRKQLSTIGDDDVDLLHAIEGLFDTVNTDIPATFEELLELINADQFPRFYESVPLVAPITVTEGGPPTVVQTLVIAVPEAGRYRLAVNFTCQFTTFNDVVRFRSTGTAASGGTFLVIAQDNDEVQPYYFELAIDVLDTVPFDTTLEMEVTGPGSADVIIPKADFFLQRVG